MFEKIKHKIAKKRILSYLYSDPDRMYESSLNGLIPAFQNAAESVPAYKQILKEHRVDLKEIESVEDFKEKVPIIKKEDVFGRFGVSDLFSKGILPLDIVTAFTSSGYSGVYSYGVVNKKDNENQKLMIDVLLDIVFKINEKKAVIINALPMGVQFCSSYPVISTSVKSGMVVSFLKLFNKKFDSIVIITDTYFAKKIIEEGKEKGINWKNENVSFIIGGQWFSNSFLNYLDNKSGIPGERILSTMGLSELGLNLFNDSPSLKKIRDFIQKNDKLRKELFGDVKAVPEIMYYYPYRTFAETVNTDENGFGEIVLSTLNSSMPLFRYNTKDIGKLFGSEDFKNILKKYNCVLPEFNLPIVAVSGRSDSMEFKGIKVFPQDVEEALFRDTGIAERITGCFKINTKLKIIEIQLQKGIKPDVVFERKVREQIKEFIGILIPVKIYDYSSFPYFMEVDYESKFRFI